MYYRIIISKGADRVVNELPEALKTFRQDFDVRVFVDRNKGDWHMPMEWHKSEIIADMAFAGTEQTVQSRR